MNDTVVTIASLQSILIDPERNLETVRGACERAAADGARLLLLPELMLTGHGGHPRMAGNAEPVPWGPLSQGIVELSKIHDLCICVGIAELSNNTVFNSQMVADRGEYLGLQRKINLSGDEYCHFRAGETVTVFDIGDIRFGITICYDNHFPEIGVAHALNNVDLILAPHAARTGDWPDELTPEFCAQKIRHQQESWEKTHRGRSYHHNVFTLVCNAAGSATEGLDGVVANHAGTVMGVAPNGDVFRRTDATDFSDEIVTVTLDAGRRQRNHSPARNRRFATLIKLLQETQRGPG